MNDEIKREIILDNYEHPVNRRRVDNKNYIKVRSNNESCIDDIDLYVLIEDDVIKDITFDGEACAISIASSSIMIKNLLNKSIEEAKAYITNFYNMVNENNYDKDLLKEGLVFDTIYKQGSRKTCALIPYEGIKQVLDIKEEK